MTLIGRPWEIAVAMVVDDSALQRNHTASLCRSMGIGTVQTAANGAEAIAQLTTLSPRPGLVILDLEMPVMDGYQTLSKMQELGIDIPVLVVSSRERSLLELVSDMGSALGLRVVGSLQKPLTRKELSRVLLSALPDQCAERSGTALQLNANDIMAAIAQGDIHAHFQPKVDVRTAKLCGVEALARWNHPTLGSVPPAEFIPLAEHNGLIHNLTMRVMNEAMEHSAAWMSEGLRLSTAINLSPVLLERATLPDEIQSMQQTHGLLPDQVILEITESSVVSGRSVGLGVLARLRLKGFGLSIDDYGTGFSSMQQLTRVPFTELKVDRSFVHYDHTRENREVILRSALELANRLGITSVAEGVETMEDWRLLQRLGCAVAQGYLIGKPMPGAELTGWLREYEGRMDGLKPAPARAQLKLAR